MLGFIWRISGYLQQYVISDGSDLWRKIGNYVVVVGAVVIDIWRLLGE